MRSYVQSLKTTRNQNQKSLHGDPLQYPPHSFQNSVLEKLQASSDLNRTLSSGSRKGKDNKKEPATEAHFNPMSSIEKSPDCIRPSVKLLLRDLPNVPGRPLAPRPVHGLAPPKKLPKRMKTSAVGRGNGR
jgi:hypothetical protein